MANDYKATPYRPDKEFHKVGEQNWTILRSNDKGSGYVKPDLINLNNSKSIMGFGYNDSFYLLFQANDLLVSCEGKPELAKVSFGSFTDGKWVADDAGAKAWKEGYEASNKWCALDCNFPILKSLAKWLDSQRMIIAELVYIKNNEVNEAELFKALHACKKAIVEGEELETFDNEAFKYLKNFGLDTIEFEEKPIFKVKSKMPPVEGLKKNEEGFAVYDKAFFNLPASKSGSSTSQKTYASEAAKASSRLDFLLANADKVKELLKVYTNPTELALALAIAGVEVHYQAFASYRNFDDPVEVSTELVEVKEVSETLEEKPKESVPEDDLKVLIETFGDTKVKKFLAALDGLEATGNPVSLVKVVSTVKTIVNSTTFSIEPKNILVWAKEHFKSGNSSTRSILDLSLDDLENLAVAVKIADSKAVANPSFTIIELDPKDLDLPAF